MARELVYGPVPSRRYGLSLGVDLLPRKICSYDCVYCQVGPTQELCVERRDFVPPEAVEQAVAHALERGPRPEVLTLAGSGEPSLVLSLGRLIERLKRLSGVPVLLLTNGSLLWREDVAADASRADILAPSLDAPDEATFAAINRPHPGVDFGRMLAGLRQACARHPGTVRLEVMLAAGWNDNEERLEAFGRVLRGIRAEVVDINTPVRPAPGRSIQACSPERLECARARFGPGALLVGGFRGGAATPVALADAERVVLELLARRPCTQADLRVCLGLGDEVLADILRRAREAGRVRAEARPSGLYFFAG